MDKGDSELLNRGFRTLSLGEIIRAAVMALQSVDSDEEKREWARGVLEGLPRDEKATPAK